MNTDQELINLPPNWAIEYADTGGFTCFDGRGGAVAQSPVDNNFFRRTCWERYYDLLAHEVAKLRRKDVRQPTALDRAIVERIVCIVTGEDLF